VKSVERFSVTVSERTGAIDQNLDSDGDGVSDEDEINGGTDPFDSGSFIPSLRSPVYAVWNGFLAMTNILELVNPNDFAIRADVSLYAIDGKLKRVQPVMVPPMGQFDLILNNLPGFTADSYGVIKIEFEGILDGRMSFYRNSQVPGEFDFAYSIELSDPSRGETAVSFNTYQPSMNPAEARNQVANWLTVVNFANAAKSYRVKTFDQTGGLLADRMLRVPAFGRVDVDGGHVLVGPNVVGMHTITPSDPQAPYTAQLTRYAGNTDGSSLPTAYSFAFPLVARAGTGRELVMPVTRQFNESNWVELINTSNDSVRAHIRILDANGHELFSERTALRAHAQKHYDVSSRFAPGATGIALVTADTPNALIMQSMVYLRNSWGGVEAMYGSQGKEAIGHAVFGSYNRFLGMENWLKVVNYSASAAQIQLIVNSANSSKEEVFTLPAYGSTVLPIHNGARFGTVENSYGTVEVRGAGGVNFFAELLRLKRAGANPDFAAPTAVR
jgi:hypothetical protein